MHQTPNMNIRHAPESDGGEFFVEGDGDRVAEMTYALEGSVMNIRHTYVDAALGGKGLGKQLVGQAVQFARENGLQVKATCSFARAVLAQVPAYADVVAP